LQWRDAATIDLLEHLITHLKVRLFLVGAYRENEVGPAHPLMRTLEAIRQADAKVQEMVLVPSGSRMSAGSSPDALHCEFQRERPLAQLVQEKTGGNPFCHPILQRADRRGTARVRRVHQALAMGHRTHPRAQLQ
jgi:predicted ATPase